MAAPKTVKTITLDGSTKDFEIPFEYLARKFVVLTLIGTDRKELVLNVDYRFTQRTIVTTTKAWGPVDGYTLIELKRVTSATERLVDFSDGSILRASDLNTATIQALHIAEEGRDIATDTIGVDNNGNLDARGRRIVNVATAVDPGDSVPLQQVRDWDTSALNSKNAAKVSETNAMASELEAKKSELAAAISEANAKDSELEAVKRWDHTVRVPVEEGTFPPMPVKALRSGRLLGFNANGDPELFAPTSGSTADLALTLATSQGADLVGCVMPDGSPGKIQTALDFIIEGHNVVVPNVAALATLPVDGSVNSAKTLGYFAKGDRGYGRYYPDLEDTTSVVDNITVFAGVGGVRWKLLFDNTLRIQQGGGVSGDVADLADKMALILHKRNGGTLLLQGAFNLSKKVSLYPQVTIASPGSGYRNRIDVTHNGNAFETTRPAGYTPSMVIGAQLKGLSLIGRGVALNGVAVALRNCMQCKIVGNEIALFGFAFVWNSGHTPTVFVQAFFNLIEQNIIKPCGRGHYFGGAANRNTIRLNSYSDCNIAYDFGATDNWSETNTFDCENVEGCRSWAEWGYVGAVYSQTWINLCIENPSTNGYKCIVKDPGRQVFVNLSIIPLSDTAAIEMVTLYNRHSVILGSQASSGQARLGVRIAEDIHLYEEMFFYRHASYVLTGTFKANSTTQVTIPLANAKVNDRAHVYALRSLMGLHIVPYSEAGVVIVDVTNSLNYDIPISGVELSVRVENFK